MSGARETEYTDESFYTHTAFPSGNMDSAEDTDFEAYIFNISTDYVLGLLCFPLHF